MSDVSKFYCISFIFLFTLKLLWGGGGSGVGQELEFLCVCFFFLLFSFFVVMNRQSFIFNVKCVLEILTTALFYKVAFERHNKYKRLVFLYVFLHIDIDFFSCKLKIGSEILSNANMSF